MLRYQQIRSQIRTGDLLFWSGSDLVSKVIKFLTHSDYSHVGMAWVSAGRVFVMEAFPPSVRILPASSKPPFYWVPMFGLSEEALNFAMKHVGDPYSRLDAIKAYFKLRLPKGSWECAEYVARIYKHDNIPMTLNKYTPGDIMNWCKKLNLKVKFVNHD